MRRLRRYSLFLAALLCVGVAQAQYYSWGDSPAGIRWSVVDSPDYQLIYPDYFEQNARRVGWYVDAIKGHVDYGFRHGTMRTPVVLHTQNAVGNGTAMWAPKRIELLAAPASTYSEPWLKQLAIHEWRHNVQYNNLRRSTNRVLTWLLGEQIAFLGSAQFSIFVLEGDATMLETEMSAFGRGLQPSFTMHYRAMARQIGGEVGSRAYSGDYWFSGSFRDFVPDHYRLGYQLVRWVNNEYGRFVWDDVARFVSRNPYMVVPMSVALRRTLGKGMGLGEIYRRTFADLNEYWRGLPQVSDSSTRIGVPWTSYTTYEWPLWLDDGTLVAFKSDYDRPRRIVRVGVGSTAVGDSTRGGARFADSSTIGGGEEILAYTGAVSSRPVLAAGRLWWTEYRGSMLWDERVTSRLCSYDFSTDRKRVYPSERSLLYPVAVGGGGEMAFVAYDGDLPGIYALFHSLRYTSHQPRKLLPA